MQLQCFLYHIFIAFILVCYPLVPKQSTCWERIIEKVGMRSSGCKFVTTQRMIGRAGRGPTAGSPFEFIGVVVSRWDNREVGRLHKSLWISLTEVSRRSGNGCHFTIANRNRGEYEEEAFRFLDWDRLVSSDCKNSSYQHAAAVSIPSQFINTSSHRYENDNTRWRLKTPWKLIS